ncbi:glucosyltransferase domain-containing protein [Desulfovibrio gilichinskyi]|uniref:Glucosyl transferase GtrII n=1 Tax=Desulfovibrio gilichinskyi TaxID=1519643 RepID=A0A1X7EHS5_9BACT|nr:glucosyltransferase domain-containing protein [Desulfovibrio gilichinskyi]SMF34176.1 Glucosyl transferase GtrII [Desulfovibrio gilichinskyi]
MEISKFDINSYIATQYEKISRSDKIAFLFSIFIGLCAHGAALLGFFINEDDNLGQFVGYFTSGRFFSDIVYGSIECQPFQFFQTFIFILLVAASGVLVAKLLSAKSTTTKSVIAGLIISYPAFSVGMTYTMVTLVYAVAIYFSILSVYFVNKDGWGNFFIGSVFLTLSLGTYQAYLSVTATLCTSVLLLFVLEHDMAQKNNLLLLLKKTGLFFLYAVVSGVFYIGAVKLSTLYHHAELGKNQGADRIGSIDVSFSALQKIYTAYTSFLNNHFFNMPSFFYTLLSILSILTIIVILCRSISQKSLQTKIVNIALSGFILFIILIMGFAVTFVAPFAEINILQTYGIMIIIALSVSIVAEFSNWTKNVVFVLALLMIMMFSNRNNAQYYKASLITRATLLTVNRIFSRVEEMKGFSADSKIAIVGNLPNDILKSEQSQPYNEISSGYSGNFVGLSRPNQSHKFSTIMSFLGYDVKHIEDDKDFLRACKMALHMPIYPQKGAIAIDGDLVVIKLNEPHLTIKPTLVGDRKYHFEYTPFSESKNLDYFWTVVDVTAQKGKNLSTSNPKLDIQFDTAGNTCYVIGVYVEKGTNEVIESTPYWFIVN